MQQHYFSFRKHAFGKPQIDIEIRVSADISRQEARRIADEEIKALKDGYALAVHQELRRQTARMETQIVRIPDIRFRGAN